MSGTHQDRRAARREELRRERMRHYARQGTGTSLITSPRRPVALDAGTVVPGVHDDTRPVIGCVTAVLVVVYVGQLIDEALRAHSHLVVPLRVVFVAAILGVLASFVAMVRQGRGKAVAPAEVAVPWQDVVEGVRLGSVEPANPAWTTAAGLVEDVRPHVAKAISDARTEDRVRRIREAGALVHATSEEWREHRAAGTGGETSPLDRLPPLVGPTLREASVASDAASDAAVQRLGSVDHDLDFDGWARRRAAMYARQAGGPVTCQDPRGPLVDATFRLEDARRRARAVRRATACGVVVTAAVLLIGHPWASTVPAAATLLLAVLLARVSPRDPALLTTTLPPGAAMAWRDYLDAVAYVDSGIASVPTVEAVRGCEQRVRALVLELAAASRSTVEEPVLAAELHRLCSGAWTLVGQERAEARLLDDLDARPGTDPA
ncbi:hypothetical protein GCM10011376_09480 [Nocardioides flavus (ex Wang et al. 2016)]|uniref:DUF4407 domain-containing protein n=1 Tax=Nocardioides flavus (ex Wang et al. 2016) TaxID=2058780 RepID=A0ABQ3HHI5_9ACTN|nr:hypothetical protein [Nocardioides flavus (ex Wang et al. 2016)]GHE16338.1 hypothetical protein GCM10011376_09480 [Nocardioides flavus (ex Wang et al. 2016)]